MKTRSLLILSVAVVVCVGLALGYFYERSREPKPQVVVVGSANVHSWLKRYRQEVLAGVEELYLDIGSADALNTVFSAFDYGRSVEWRDRPGFVALSSTSHEPLGKQFAQAPEDLKKDNYWLAIVLARRPLFISYRGIDPAHLVVQTASAYPPTGTASREIKRYPYVEYSNLSRVMFNKPSNLTLYLPEESSGTRRTFEASLKTKPTWPTAEQVPTHVDQLFGSTPFLSIQSDLQELRSGERYDECQLLRDNNIQIAAICSEGPTCANLMESRYAIIVKIARRASLGTNNFLITNRAECKLARDLAPSEVTIGCTIKGTADGNHVLAIEAANNLQFSNALQCEPKSPRS